MMYLGSLVHSGNEFRFPFPKSIPRPIRQVIVKACRLRAADRYPDARAMRAALRAALEETSDVRRRRRPLAALGLSLALLVLVTVGAYQILVRDVDPTAFWTLTKELVWATADADAVEQEDPAAAKSEEASNALDTAPKDSEDDTETLSRQEQERREEEERIGATLLLAGQQLAKDQLTSPVGDNALESYRAVLAVRPNDPDAVAGLGLIGARYVRWAERAEANEDLGEAVRYYDRALLAVPGDQEVERRLAVVVDRIAQKREEREQRIAEQELRSRESVASTEKDSPDPLEEKAIDSPSTPGMVRVAGGPSGVGAATSAALGSFEIDRTEVTAAAYDECLAAGVCTPLLRHRACNSGKTANAKHPANCVSFTQARTYCEWAEKRLPSGEEWEKAARGPDARPYPWGSDAPSCSLLVTRTPGCRTTAPLPVGSKPAGASPYGALDMMGNVWEWTADQSGGRAILRGGAFNTAPVTADHRYPYSDKGTPSTGFRCAR